jgi:hypothetical protein
MTKAQARALVAGAGGKVMRGTRDEITTAALAECEAAARREGWRGPWESTPADEEYVHAQIVLGGPYADDAERPCHGLASQAETPCV